MNYIQKHQLKEWNRPGIEGAVKEIVNNSNLNKIKIEILKNINKTALNNANGATCRLNILLIVMGFLHKC